VATSFHYSELVPSWAKASDVLKGDVVGHEFHGNQYTESTGNYLNYISDRATKFYESGGQITSYGAWSDNKTELKDEMEKLRADVQKIEDGGGTYGLNMEWRRKGEMVAAWDLSNRDGSKLMIARNANGELVGAMNYSMLGGGDLARAGVVGSLENSNGAGTALEYELARVADQNNMGVASSTHFGSENYHQAIGRSFKAWQIADPEWYKNNGSPTAGSWVPTDTPKQGDKSFWSREQTAQIGALNLPAPAPIQKGDVKGHDFHGNQWTQGQGGSGDWKPVMTKAEADEWAKNSKVQQTLYHGTSAEAIAEIFKGGFDPSRSGTNVGQAFGNGVYLASSAKVALNYLSKEVIPEWKVLKEQRDKLSDANIKIATSGGAGSPEWESNVRTLRDLDSQMRQVAEEKGADALLKIRINVENPATPAQTLDIAQTVAQQLGYRKDFLDIRGSETVAKISNAMTAEAQKQGYDALSTFGAEDNYVVFDPKKIVVVK